MPSPQFTIRGLMGVTATVAVVLALFQYDPALTIVVIEGLLMNGLAWQAGTQWPGLASRGFWPSAAWLNLSLFVQYAYHPVFHNSMYLFLSSLVFFGVVPGLGVAWVKGQSPRRRRVRAGFVVSAAVGLAFSMMVTMWPFRLGFWLSSPALNRLADRLEAGGALGPNEWVGIYPVRGTLPINGDLTFIIDNDPGGMSGFIRRRGSTPSNGRDSLDMSGTQGGRWYYLDQD